MLEEYDFGKGDAFIVEHLCSLASGDVICDESVCYFEHWLIWFIDAANGGVVKRILNNWVLCSLYFSTKRNPWVTT